MALAYLAILWHQRVDCSGAPAWLQGPFPSPFTCVAETSGATVLCSGVGSCSGTAGGSLQNAPEGSFGTYGPATSRFLQSAVPCREGDRGGGGGGGGAARHRPVSSERLCYDDEESDGDPGIRVRVYQEKGLDVLDRPEGHLLPDSCPSGISTISSVLS